MKTNPRGFTLIEALIYLALFSILIGGAVVSAFDIFEAATYGGTHTLLQEETDFILGKIEWALTGAQAVTAPAPGTAGSALTVVKWDTSVGNPLVFALNGANLTLSRAGASPAILNNTNTEIKSITFTHIQASGDGTNPEAVETVLTVAARTPNGIMLTRIATSTVYLRH